MTKEEKIKDLGFLKEMKDNIDKMANSFNLTNIQHVQTMINDWIDELEEEEPNNGWIKIESEDDLPYCDFEDLWVFINDKVKLYSEVVRLRNLESGYFETDITHYHPIEKPKPPIY